MEKDTPRVFISYATVDGGDTAAEVRTLLENNEMSVWQDIVSLRGESDWWSQIESVLRSKTLEHFVVILTPGALSSEAVRQEIRLARQEGKSVSPVRGQGILNLEKVPRWIGNVFDLNESERKELFLRVLKEPGAKVRVPMMAPEPPSDFVLRNSEFNAIKEKLLNSDVDAVGITAALKGAGGYGKTTLARALAHDPVVVESFYDGTLWVEVGERPENLTAIVSDLVERLTGQRPGVETLNAAGAALGEAIGNRRVLIIIDDVWRSSDLSPFMRGGNRATRLITTRNGSVLPSATEIERVDAMQPDEAMSLIQTELPLDQIADCFEPLSKLTERLGEWPLLLRLANGFLRYHIENHGSLKHAVAEALGKYKAKGVTAFDARNEQDRTNAVAATIAVSLELLTQEQDRTRFFELSLFPEDAAIPVATIARLWAETGGVDRYDADDLLREFHSLSLLLSIDLSAHTVQMHDTIRHYAKSKLESPESLHSVLIRVLGDLSETSESSPIERHYFFTYLPYHLSKGTLCEELDSLLSDPQWIARKTLAMGSPVGLLSDYGQYGTRLVHELILDALRLSTHICVRDPEQTLVQVVGRIRGLDDEECTRFTDAATLALPKSAIMVMSPTLTSPGVEVTRIDGHKGEVTSLANLKDGRLASGSSDHTVRIWGKGIFEEQTCLEGHTDWVVSIAEAGDVLYSGGEDKSVYVWNMDDESPAGVHEDFESGIISLIALGDLGVVAGTWDGTAVLFATDDLPISIQLGAEAGSIAAFCLQDSGRLICGCGDGKLRTLDLMSESFAFFCDGHNASVTCLVETTEGTIATGAVDGSVMLWDGHTGNELRTLAGQAAAVRSMCALDDGGFVTGDSEGVIKVWTSDGRIRSSVKGHTSCVNTLIRRDDDQFASGSSDGTIKIWTTDSSLKTAREHWPNAHSSSVTALEKIGRGGVISASWDRSISYWILDSDTECQLIHERQLEWSIAQPISSVAGFDDGKLMIGCIDGTLVAGLLGEKVKSEPQKAHDDFISAILPLGCGGFATASHDRTIKLWGKVGMEPTRILEGHQYWISDLALHGDRGLLSSSWDGTVRGWSVDSLESELLISRESGARTVSYNGRGMLAAGFDDGEIAIVHNNGSEEQSVWHQGAVVDLDWITPRLLLSVSDRVVEMWDVQEKVVAARIELDVRIRCLLAATSDVIIAGDVSGNVHSMKIAGS